MGRNENGIRTERWGCGREQKWGTENDYWVERGMPRDAETQGMVMGNVNGDWEGGGRKGRRQELRTGMGDKSEDKVEGQD